MKKIKIIVKLYIKRDVDDDINFINTMYHLPLNDIFIHSNK